MIYERDDVRCLVEGDAQLGEGPVWVEREDALYWVDIVTSRIFRWLARSGETTCWHPPFQVASLAPVAGGGFIAGTARGFAFVDPASERYEVIARPAAEPAGNRFNDGKLDRSGRFWAGTMDDAEQEATGALYRFEPAAEPRLIEGGYRVTNGPAFDLAGHRMYHTDTARQSISMFDLGEDGEVANKRLFARFEPSQGYPDGMTIDGEDCLWVAFWDGWCLRRFSPDGEQIAEVPLPVGRPTSCVFGGADLATLFITTARVKLSDGDLAGQPLAGSIFALESGVRGVADTLFDPRHLL